MESLIGWVFGLAFLFLGMAAILLPWINRSRIVQLENQISRLQKLLSEKEKTSKEAPQAATPEKTPPQKQTSPAATTDLKPESKITESPASAPHKEKKTAKPWPTPEDIGTYKKTKAHRSFEEQFGARLPVWVGGIALSLAGFFFVKYAIDIGLLTQKVRVILGGVFGLALLGAASWVREKEGFSNKIRIAQSLSGSGIAVLYFSLYAATTMYQLLPPWLGFTGMAATTASAVVLSIRHGPPIAMLGMAGGFLTPALISSAQLSTPLMFLYLFSMFTGLMMIIQREHWWKMSILVLLGAWIWVPVWLTGYYGPDDSLWLGLFLLGVCLVIVFTTRGYYSETKADEPNDSMIGQAVNYLGMGGAMVLMGFIAGKGGFGWLDWGMYGLLAIGSVALAFFKDERYGFVPWLSMGVNAVMLMSWFPEDPAFFTWMLILFASLYVVSGYLLMKWARAPVLWAILSAATALLYYLLAYYRLHDITWVHGVHLWGIIATGLSAASVVAVFQVPNDFNDYEKKEVLLSIFTAVAAAFFSIAITIELEREFLSVAFAMQVLALAWINGKVSIKALRPITAVVAAMFGILLMPQILLLFQLSVYSLIEMRLQLQETIPIVEWPIFQLGVPSVMFIGASILLRKQKEDMLVRSLEGAAIALLGVMGYYLTRHAFHLDENVLFVKAGFFERGMITNILFVYGLGCFAIGKHFARTVFDWGGLILCGVALFRIAYFDLLIHNPLWARQEVSGYPLFNSLILPFGLPIFWSQFAANHLQRVGKPKLAAYLHGFQLVMLFLLVTLNVRQIYHGEWLYKGDTSNAEFYTYSAAWLLLGIALLSAGVLRQNKMIRIASLIIMVLTVGKVFLFDAGELEGLYRVLSFFGLGLCLLGLSYFYTRFVFKDQDLAIPE